VLVHGKQALDNAQKATQILFGNATHEEVLQLAEETLMQIAQEVPFKSLEKSKVLGVSVIDVLHEAGFLASKSEARRELKANAIAINKEKIGEDYIMQEKNLLKNRYVLFQKGKKQYFLLEIMP
jgi:tyrosyl-tRNA synthetase